MHTIEERVTALLGASAGVEARVMGLERRPASLQQVRGFHIDVREMVCSSR
jgi:hypothetical protein